MKVIQPFTLALLFLGVAACGGDGTGIDTSSNDSGESESAADTIPTGSTPTEPDEPAGPASSELTLSNGDQAYSLTLGEQATVTLSGSVNITPEPEYTYLQAKDLGGVMTASSTKTIAAGGSFSFDVRFTTPEALTPGSHSGTLQIHVCEDPQCNDVVSGTEASLEYNVNMVSSYDWETHQGTAAHRGYVPFTLNPDNFSEAWTWKTTAPSPDLPINPVVTEGGKVFVSQSVYHEQGLLFALNEQDGSEAWRLDFGEIPALNPPAISDGQVYVSTSGHEDTFLYGLNANDGSQVFKVDYQAQWPQHMAPTVYRDQVFHAGGYYGGLTHVRRTQDGVQDWEFDADGIWDMYTPAVDADYVYHYNGEAMFVLNRVTGSVHAEIADPNGDTFPYSYHGAPALGSDNNVITFSGPGGGERVITSFNTASGTIEWVTPYSYLTHYALADGVLYAARNDSMSLDAIDEETGQVLWSWAPATAEDSSFHRNIVVTDNLLFVSTNTNLYALDLDSRQPVWSYPEPGMIAISAYGTLLIATGATQSDGGLVAIDL